MIAATSTPRLVVEHGAGEVAIEQGGVLGPVLRRLAGLPEGERCAVEFCVERTATGVRWGRRYRTPTASTGCDTTVVATAVGFLERRGPVVMEFVLVDDDRATLRSVRLFGVPLPRRMLSSRIESAAMDGGLRTEVWIVVGGGSIGWLRYVAELTEVTP